ncbi:MAG: hypothetical protein AAFP89_10650 [Bacteroidota bacterium]
MGLLEYIFGPKRQISDDYLGTIERQRARKEKEGKEYTWYASHSLPRAPEETDIFLEGSYHTPNPKQLNELKRILKNYEDLFEKIHQEVGNRKLKPGLFDHWSVEEWKNNYFLLSVFPLDGIKPSFELYFEPIHDTRVPDILFDFVHGEMRNLSI